MVRAIVRAHARATLSAGPSCLALTDARHALTVIGAAHGAQNLLTSRPRVELLTLGRRVTDALSCAVVTRTVTVAVSWTVRVFQIARRTLPTGVARALAVRATVSVIRAIARAGKRRAVVTSILAIAIARALHASSVTRAVVGTFLELAVRRREARVASTHAVVARSVTMTIVLTSTILASFTLPIRLARACTVVHALTMMVAVVFARLDRARDAVVSVVAHALGLELSVDFAELARAMIVAIAGAFFVLTSVAIEAIVAFTRPLRLVALSMTAAIVRTLLLAAIVAGPFRVTFAGRSLAISVTRARVQARLDLTGRTRPTVLTLAHTRVARTVSASTLTVARFATFTYPTLVARTQLRGELAMTMSGAPVRTVRVGRSGADARLVARLSAEPVVARALVRCVVALIVALPVSAALAVLAWAHALRTVVTAVRRIACARAVNLAHAVVRASSRAARSVTRRAAPGRWTKAQSVSANAVSVAILLR